MPIRVLNLIDTGGPGGAENVLLNLSDGLPEEHFTTLTVVPRRGWLFECLRERGKDVFVIEGRGSPDFPLLGGLLRIVRKFRPHLLHSHLLTSSVYGSLACAASGDLPLVATFHGLPDVDVGDRLLYLKSRILGRSRNRFVFVAKHLKEQLESVLRLDEANCRVIHNGIPFDPMLPENGAPISPDRLWSVGTLGNIRPAKDYRTFLRAAAIVKASFPQVRFLVAGSGREEDMRRLEVMKDELGLGEALQFLGFVNDPRRFLVDLDLFVSSSITEGLPLSILEAAGSGRPVVASACNGNREVLEGLPGAVLVPPRDHLGLAQGILSTLTDYPRVSGLARAAAAEVRDRFGLSRMIDGYIHLYHSLTREQA